MVFSSMIFLTLFFPIVFLLYHLIRNFKVKNILLTVFSVIFYAWGEPKWIFVMLLTVTVNYCCGLMIDRTHRQIPRTIWMIVGVSLSLGFLIYFKYFGFFSDVFFSLMGRENPFIKPTLPIGISFYTFQVLTYTVDVYRRKVDVQKSYLNLLLYVSFFPQLIAGPIVNYTDISSSLNARTVSWEDIYRGLLRFITGLAKKVLLANTCGSIAEELTETNLSVAGSWLLALSFALQIYYDFSGYSDMAIGMGRMFGFHFFENFNYPYISKSITEFWRRWHISLGVFFRDYVYIPLGGNRVSKLKNVRNILVVWLLTGFWHGASWNFLVWGIYYGVLLLAEKMVLSDIKTKLPKPVNHMITLFFVLVGWVLFYYENLGDGIAHLSIMLGFARAPLNDPFATYYFKHNLLFLGAAVIASYPWKTTKVYKHAESFITRLEPIAATLLFIISITMIITQSYNPFLYFRF